MLGPALRRFAKWSNLTPQPASLPGKGDRGVRSLARSALATTAAHRGASRISLSPGAAEAGAYAALAFVVIVWGGSFVAARLVLAPGSAGGPALPPTLLAAARFVAASAVFVPVLAGQRLRGAWIARADLPGLALLGLLGVSLYFWLQYTGVKLTSAGLSALLVVGLIPLASLLIAALVGEERITARRAAALALGAAGVAVVVSQTRLALAVESGFLAGALCLVGNAFCFAVYTTLVRRFRARYSPLALTAATMVVGTVGLVALSLVVDDWRALGRLTAVQWLAMGYLAFVCSALAYFLYNYALSRLEASRAAVWLYLEPVVALALGALLLGEGVAIQTVAGGLVILAGVYLAQGR